MKTLFSFTLFILCSFNVVGQDFIGDFKSVAKLGLKRYKKSNDSINVLIKETKSTLELIVDDTTMNSLKIRLEFDKRRKCISKTLVSDCQECFDLYLNELIQDNRYEWIKLTEYEYISKYSKRRLLFIKREVPFTYTLRGFIMTKVEYDNFLQEYKK